MNRDSIPAHNKLIHHLDHIKSIVECKNIAPINVSVWPTSKCQCNCSFCCFKSELKNTGEIFLNDFKQCIDVLSKYGTKSIEMSGGGEPLMWGGFIEGVEYVHKTGLKLGLMTNGYLLKKIPDSVLSLFRWIRVSIHSFNHFKMIDFERISKLTKISTSYIISNIEEINELEKIHKIAKEINIIVRVAVIRPTTVEFEKVVNEKVNSIGLPLYFSIKSNEPAQGCYMPWIKAAIDWRSMFLPCPAIQFNNSEGKIPKSFALCHINDLENWLLSNKPHDLGYRCKFCNCGKENNDLIHNLKCEVEDVDFI